MLALTCIGNGFIIDAASNINEAWNFRENDCKDLGAYMLFLTTRSGQDARTCLEEWKNFTAEEKMVIYNLLTNIKSI